MATKRGIRAVVTMLVLGPLSAPGVALADDETEVEPFTFYGHINYALMHVDDGVESDAFLADNDVSNTRFGIFYEWYRQNGDRLRFHAETSLGLLGTSTATMDDNKFDFDYSNSEELRKFELEYITQKRGIFSFGQGSTATDGVAEADLSGTTVVSSSSIDDLAGAFVFQGGAPADGDITVSDAFSNFDGARRLRIRYDTPAFNGIVFAASAGKEVLDSDDDRDFYDLSGTHKEENETRRLERRLGLSVADDEKVLIGSLSYLHKPSGISVTLAGGSNWNDDGDYFYSKLGYEKKILDFGFTAFSAEYYKGRDFALSGSDSDYWALSAVQRVEGYDLEIYTTYSTYSFDASGSSYEDIDVFAIGARWRF